MDRALVICVAALAAALLPLAACSHEPDDDNSDDDGAAPVDDDVSPADDDASPTDDDQSPADDDDDDDSSIRSCEDIPRAGLGEKVASETLVCSDRTMKSEPWDCCGPFEDLSGADIASQAQLEEVIGRLSSFSSWDPDVELCQPDFGTVSILAVGDTINKGSCASITICDVYDDGQRLTALVYYDECIGVEASPTSPFHFVQIPATAKDVEFKFFVYYHNDYEED